MEPLVKKALKILIDAQKQGRESEGFVEDMRFVKSNLSEEEWSILKDMTLFGILQTTTVLDCVVIAEQVETP